VTKLTFYGATEGVTGSCYLLETSHSRILLECGLIQGSRDQEQTNNKPFPFDVHKLDAVVLSHAHLDHSGRIPKLVADGYTGSIYMTHATCELLEILLKDAAFIEQRDTEWENKHRDRTGKQKISPLFTIDDVIDSLSLRIGVEYDLRLKINQDIEICFRDAGHILGSAIVEIFIHDSGKVKKLVFSGDLGNGYAALLPDPEIIDHADILLLESTYGDRDHRSMSQTLSEFEEIVTHETSRDGNILIPSFAVGRTQEIIFRLGELYQQDKLPQQAVYLDSPMAIAATEVYHRYQDTFNREDRASLLHSESGSLHTFLPILKYSRTAEESMAINNIKNGAIIIAGSGMCNGGRIRHHFKHNLWRSNTHVIIVGFQVMGTPGRALVDGAKSFSIGKEKISVNAIIHTLGGFSAHADQTQLINWASNFNNPRPKLYLVHGETKAKIALSSLLSKKDWDANTPHYGQSITF
jgi:metallo-beta-lactamase family protein